MPSVSQTAAMTFGLVFAVFVLAVVVALLATLVVQARRLEFIRRHRVPARLLADLRRRHPQLAPRDAELVASGLRQFFVAAARSHGKAVSMPSQVADDLWHAFLHDAGAYRAYCQRAFGRLLHHAPAVTLGSVKDSNAGLRRVWWHACREEGIDPRAPSRLPLLFALDAKLGIAGGFRYLPDCHGAPRRDDAGTVSTTTVVHCAGDFCDPSFDGTTDGLGDGSGDSGGDGGGDGGGGD
jgi:hypothetical protein